MKKTIAVRLLTIEEGMSLPELRVALINLDQQRCSQESIKVEWDISHEYNSFDDADVYLQGSRLETDEEHRDRIRDEVAQVEASLAQAKAAVLVLEKLKLEQHERIA